MRAPQPHAHFIASGFANFTIQLFCYFPCTVRRGARRPATPRPAAPRRRHNRHRRRGAADCHRGGPGRRRGRGRRGRGFLSNALNTYVYGQQVIRMIRMESSFLEEGSEIGGAVARAEPARRGLRVAGADAGDGDGRDGDRALCPVEQERVQLATGDLNGMVRVCRASSTYESGENSGLVVDGARGRADEGSVAGERAQETNAGTPGDRITCLAASGDVRWLVSGSGNGVLRVWDTDSGACVAALRGHDEGEIINGIEVGFDGKVIASCGSDGTARLWKLRGPDQWTCALVLPHESRVSCVILDPDYCVFP